MSLLLEALKKAERAKEEAQRRARGDGEAGELRLEGAESPAPALSPAPATEEKPPAVMTRAELPDIRQPLEILSDDISPKEPEPEPAAALAPPAAGGDKAASAQRPATAQVRSQAETGKQPQAQAAERATAKKVFEAKFKESNPRLPFYIAMGLLGVFAVGTAGYFWYELRPPPSLVNTNPKPAGNEGAAALGDSKPGATAPGSSAPAGPAAIPGLPGAPAAASAAAASAPITKPAAAASQASTAPEAAPAPRPAPAPRLAAASPASTPFRAAAPSAALAQTRLPPQVHPKVESGYSAYLAGNLVAARTEYLEALREDGSNRDALLGLAAVDVRTGRYESAEALYLRLLQIDPNDAHAQASLIALRTGRQDPVTTASRVKSLLATDPGANVLHFTLGNQLAQQGRWAEAQQEYFRAFAGNPDNADFAYNLAVSLDHLRQSKPALEYYRRAIALAEKRESSFDLAAARTRATQLGN
jgi:tetratricopeptide (TPR) repeat protein